MKLKLTKIALALPMSLMALGAVAENYADDIPVVKVASSGPSASLKASQAKLANRYFVLLQDEPVALYQGGIKGFKATNITASNGINATQTGKLNLKSSASITYGNYLALQQNNALANIKQALGRDVSLKNRFKIAINSLVVELAPHEVLALRKMPGVLAVEKQELQQLMTDVGPTHVGAPSIWDNPDIGGSKGEGLIVGVMDTGIASYTQSVSTYSGVSGFDNKEFHPAFADVGADGYDHTNPNGEGVYFGDCVDSPYWCNDKIIGVVSYDNYRVNAGIRDMRVGTGQDDQGHGTHVASTIAGNLVHDVQYPTVYPHAEQTYKHEYYDSEISVSTSGVAPHANIIAYKVCDLNGCWSDLTIASIEHAIANNVDVLNYSVGGGARSPWYSSDALAFLSARESGIHTAVSAGNNGYNGEKTLGSPGNSPWVTTVAALSHSRDFTEDKTATFSGGATSLEDLIGKGATSGIGLDGMLELVYAGDVESDDYAEEAGGFGYCSDRSLPRYYSEDSIQDKVVICRRGGVNADGDALSRLSKGATAAYARAAGMIFINSEDDIDNVANDMHVLPTVHLNKADGEKLLAWLAEGEDHKVSFTDSELTLNDDKADITAPFTSRGPDYFTGDYLVPDVGAPGVDILAGGLGRNMMSSEIAPAARINGDWRFMSGTSMASPHIAGMYLLMKSAQPQWTPAEAQSALMMTAFTDIKENDFGEMNRADFHRTGSGSARVNLAIDAGLVLNETRAGYEAANPLAEEYGIAGDIEGWHGQPHQMNLPSLSKGKCLIECTWTRTFKATKAGDWSISYEYYDEGFTLTADQTAFSVAEGDEVVINFTGEAVEGLGDEWVNGRVILTPSDTDSPTLTLPVVANFLAGIVPEAVEISAKRDNDSVAVKGISTVGTDDLQLTKSGIAKAKVYEFELMRDATQEKVFHFDDVETQTTMFIPLNIQADSKRLVVEVLETSSPDIDIYIGIDGDLNGMPDAYEIDRVRYSSLSETSDELIDVLDPINDTYWLLVHNFTEGPAPLAENQMLCETDQEPDEGMECADAPIMDSVKISVSNVMHDDESMTVSVPGSVAPLAEVDTRITWDKAMSEDDVYHGVFSLGTSAENNKNIGSVRVNMTRDEDDVKITDPVIQGDKISLAVELSNNNSGEDRVYNFEMLLAEGVVADIFVMDTVMKGMSMLMAADNFEYETTDGVLSWTHTQIDGASPVEFNLVLDSSAVEGMVDATPVLSATVNTSDEVDTIAPEPFFVEGRPIFSASANESTVKEGKTITLTATVVDAVIENPELSYQWTQVSGPSVSLNTTGDTVTFDAPSVSSDQQLMFELVGSNGSKSSLPAAVSVDVENKSSGGSTGLLFMVMTGFGLIFRRKAK